MNVFSFTGNLGKDCRVGGSGSGAYCGFSVAVKSGYGDKAQTHWVDCTLWGKQAESKLPDYLLKGQMVAISGEFGTREHEGKTYITCRVNSCDLVGGKSDNSAPREQAAPKPQQQAQKPDDFDPDSIPF